MQNTFSRTFETEGTEDKKFYFTPNKADNPTLYTVHINGNLDMKKCKMKKEDGGAWKIEPQQQKLPEWLFAMEASLSEQIESSVATRKPVAVRK